jgi:uncharacterized protein YndB with AHSA1/START domain
MIDESGCVVHEVRLAHPIERVWSAIADRAALAQWLMTNTFEPVAGHRFQLDRGGSQTPIEAEVLEIDPPRRIIWRWVIDGAATTVVIELRRDGEGTVLHLEHRDLPIDERPSFDTGWVEKFDALDRALKEAR